MGAIGMSKIFEFSNNEELIENLSERIALILKQEISQAGKAIIAVSGGNSPKALFAHLRNQSLDWSKVTVILVDERWLPVTHADSNEKMVRENLMQGYAAQAEFIGWIESAHGLTDAEKIADSKFQQLDLPISVVILGMGSDGHTASWFADAAEYEAIIDATQAPAVCAALPDSAPHARLTLNYSAVTQAHAMFLQINGAEKRNTLDQALSGEVNTFPISHLLNENSHLEIYWSMS